MLCDAELLQGGPALMLESVVHSDQEHAEHSRRRCAGVLTLVRVVALMPAGGCFLCLGTDTTCGSSGPSTRCSSTLPSLLTAVCLHGRLCSAMEAPLGGCLWRSSTEHSLRPQADQPPATAGGLHLNHSVFSTAGLAWMFCRVHQQSTPLLPGFTTGLSWCMPHLVSFRADSAGCPCV